MTEGIAFPLWWFAPLILCWFLVTWLVTGAALRVTSDLDVEGRGLSLEIWLAITGSGAAVGAFLGLGSVFPQTVRELEQLSLVASMAAALSGMVLAAAAAAALALLVLKR